MIRYILLVLVTFVFCLSGLQAQEKNISQVDSRNLYYQKELDVEFRLHTRGYAFGYSRAHIKTYYRTNYWRLSLGELKHEKEYRQSNNATFGNFDDPSRSFVFGKQNNLFVLRYARGIRRTIGEKARRKGISVALQGDFGPGLGLLKPYYLKVYSNNEERTLEEIKYSEDTEDLFLNRSRIYGGGRFFKGFSEVKFKPFLHGSFSSTFDWNLREDVISALDVGIMMDYFIFDTPIMVTEENNRLFVNVYVSLRVGKRW